MTGNKSINSKEKKDIVQITSCDRTSSLDDALHYELEDRVQKEIYYNLELEN